MKRSLVSVVIPTFNRADTLRRALDSVVEQTWPDWEIVLIDDGSTDRTPSVAASYADRLGARFVYVRQDNKGCCHARNRGIERAGGSFIAFLDSDDAFAPTKLERQMSLFERCPHLGLVFSDYACVDLEGKRIESAFDRFYPVVRSIETKQISSRLHECTGSLFEPLLRGYFIATIVGMVRREVLSADIRFPEHLPYAHEWLCYLQIARRCPTGFVDEPLSVHHFTRGSITRTDATRNLLDLYRLLREMPCSLAPLNRRERFIIKQHLAKASLDLGVASYREDRFSEAIRWFLRSFGHVPSPRALIDSVDSCRQWIRGSAGRGKPVRHPSRT